MSILGSVGSFVSGYMVGIIPNSLAFFYISKTEEPLIPKRVYEMLPPVAAQTLFISYFLDNSAFSMGVRSGAVVVTILTSLMHKTNMQNLPEKEGTDYMRKWSDSCFVVGTSAAVLSHLTLGPIFSVMSAALAAHEMPSDQEQKIKKS